MVVSGTTGRVFFLPAEVAQAAGAAQVTDVDMAKQHFAAANGYYRRGEYEKAVEEFGKAYDLSKRPELNYNIAICYEKLVKVKDAIAAYKLYLDEAPNAPDVEQVKSRITFLEEQISAGNAATSPVPEMVNPHAPEGVKSEVEQPPQTIIIEVKPPPKDEITAPPEKASAYRKLMWASAAAATAGLATGIIGYTMARKKQGEHDALIGDLRDEGKITGTAGNYRFVSPGAKLQYEGEINVLKGDVRMYEKVLLGGFVGAAASLVFGGLFFWLDRESGLQVNVKPSADGVNIGAQVRF